MNILVLSHVVPAPNTGEGLRLLNLAKRLSRDHGHSLSLITLGELTRQPRSQDFRDIFDEVHVVDVPRKRGEPYSRHRIVWGLRNLLSPASIFSRRCRLMDYRYLAAGQRLVDRVIEQRRFDLIYAYDIQMTLYTRDVRRPKIVDIIDAKSDAYRQLYWTEKNLPRKLLWLAMSRFERRALNDAYKHGYHTLVTTSLYDQQVLKSLLPSAEVHVVPNGVDSDYFSPLLEPEDFPSLAFCGDMGTQKNVEAVVYFYNQIYPVIKQRHPDIRFYIVGRNPRQVIRRLAADTSVVVTGYVEDVRPYIARSSVVVAPLVSGTGFINKVVEAMSMGKPVVCSPVSARAIDATPGQDILVAKEAHEFVRQVTELLADELLRLRLGQNARRLVESRYSWGAMGDRLNGIIRGKIEGISGSAS